MEKNDKYSVFEVADWFLSKEEMTPKKIQKMVYYAYAWFLTLNNDSAQQLQNKLFDEKIEAWVHGPVVHTLYNRFSNNGYGLIDTSKFANDVQESVDKVNKNSDVKSVLEQVYDVYGKYSADELESITHQESPWIKTREGLSPIQSTNRVIDDIDIFNCYIARVG